MRLTYVLTIVFLVMAPVLAQQDPHAQMKHRGAMAMGFDQEKTTHHFLLFDDGGAIDILVKETSDATNRTAIRSHLPHIATQFADGRFDIPMLVHGSPAVPGTDVMATRKTVIRFTYADTPGGGRVDIVTKDAAALAAVHDFLKYQITEHKTGDSMNVRKR